VERGAEAFGPPDDGPAFAAAGALPHDGEQSVIGADEVAAIDFSHDGAAPAADARVDHGKENAIGPVFAGERGKKMCGRLDAESGRVLKRVDDRRARRARREDCFYLADVEIGRAEVGKEDEGPGARQAAAFFSLFFSDFFAAFFSPFCASPAAAAAASARSVSVTRASGAWSPLRKPIFRMRV